MDDDDLLGSLGALNAVAVGDDREWSWSNLLPQPVNHGMSPDSSMHDLLNFDNVNLFSHVKDADSAFAHEENDFENFKQRLRAEEREASICDVSTKGEPEDIRKRKRGEMITDMKTALQQCSEVLFEEFEATMDVERIPVIVDKLKRLHRCYQQLCREGTTAHAALRVKKEKPAYIPLPGDLDPNPIEPCTSYNLRTSRVASGYKYVHQTSNGWQAQPYHPDYGTSGRWHAGNWSTAKLAALAVAVATTHLISQEKTAIVMQKIMQRIGENE